MSRPRPAERHGGLQAALLRSCGAALLVALSAVACRRPAGNTAGQAAEQAEALSLIQQQQYDTVIARLDQKTDPDSLYLLGLAWAGKARSVPLPTPAPGAPAVSHWKAEERRALELLEQAVAARPDQAAAHLAIAEIVAPHALERLASERSPGRHGGVGAPSAASSEEPDSSPELVIRHLGDAIQADPAGTAAVEALIDFATRAGRLADTDAAFQELLRRRREDPELLVRYGDFLAGPRQDPEAALSAYAQALIWRPDDAATRGKIAEIHLRAAAEHLKKFEYAAAEARLTSARRAGAAAGSPADRRLRELAQVLREIRGR